MSPITWNGRLMSSGRKVVFPPLFFPSFSLHLKRSNSSGSAGPGKGGEQPTFCWHISFPALELFSPTVFEPPLPWRHFGVMTTKSDCRGKACIRGARLQSAFYKRTQSLFLSAQSLFLVTSPPNQSPLLPLAVILLSVHEQKEKRIHGQQCGDCWGEGDIRGLNGNRKKNNKD